MLTYFRIIICLFIVCCNTAFADDLYIHGPILHFFDDPDKKISTTSYEYISDGVLWVHDGKINHVGKWQALKSTIPSDAVIQHYPSGLILPGFIDTHIHYPQVDMIAANSGGDLLQWLNTYTFPFEEKFKDESYAKEVADFFLDELLRNGTTTAMVFATIYPKSIDALFAAAEKRNMRLITGQVLGDKNLPQHLIQSPQKALQETSDLAQKWHKKPGTRLLYAITIRFAPTSSAELMKQVAAFKMDHPDLYLHTHISENQKETDWSNELFKTDNYLDIYDQYHLLGKTTLLAHGVYLTDGEENRLHNTGTSVAFCPTSNLFLGSGLFNFEQAKANSVKIGLGSDVGAGTSFSLLETLNEAYKIAQLQKQNFSALQGFYLATLGGAKALNLQDKLGNFQTGKEADLIVLNISGATPLLKRRLVYANTLADKLFVLMTLGDDRSVMATYIHGKLAYAQN